MNTFDQERVLFEQCLEHPPQDWSRLLLENCDDPELRDRVMKLLEHYPSTDSDNVFLNLDRGDPEHIGPYRILQRLGEGGMGIVYAGEQREPVRRRVAIKVLRSGYASREVLARFDIERQALALMNHPNIAHILDAGTTSDQRPYIVMEFVPGEPITRYARKHALSLRQRLELFCAVCDAVQHAHQRGIIHRDLKPSNILVAEENGECIPKIIDFGIAKAISQRLTEKTLQTQMGGLLGTPDYMSPEQAERSALDVDTRADVYALGAVLYHLLTGRPPLELGGSARSLLEMQRALLEQQPLPPSQHLAGSEQRQVRGELDWICMKALEKERNRRYDTPADLARDIRNQLANRTVSAGPPSQWRRFMKFVMRHWVGVTAVASVIVVMLASQVLMTQKNRELQKERDRANAEASTASEVTRFLLKVFDIDEPALESAGMLSAHAMLDKARREVEASESINPEARLRLYKGLGDAYEGLGLPHDAVTMYSEAVSLLPSDASAEERITLLASLSVVQRTTHRATDALDTLAKAAAIAHEAGLEEEPVSLQIAFALASVKQDLGDAAGALQVVADLYAELPEDHPQQKLPAGTYLAALYFLNARFDEASRLTRLLAPAVNEQFGAESPLALALAMGHASILSETGQHEEALRMSEVIHARQLARYDRDSVLVQQAARALALNRPNPAEGLRDLQRVLDQQRAQFGRNAPELIETLLAAGELHSRVGEYGRAADHFDKALELAERHHGERHSATYFARYFAATANAREGRHDEALNLLEGTGEIPLLRYRAARENAFAALRDDPRFIEYVGPYAPTRPVSESTQ